LIVIGARTRIQDLALGSATSRRQWSFVAGLVARSSPPDHRRSTGRYPWLPQWLCRIFRRADALRLIIRTASGTTVLIRIAANRGTRRSRVMILRRIMTIIANVRRHDRSNDEQMSAEQYFSDVLDVANRLAHVQEYLHGTVPSLDGAEVVTHVLSARGPQSGAKVLVSAPDRDDEYGADLAA
jgi:hypothetical protein